MAEENITRKYRPKKFSQVIGQEVSIKKLTAALEAKVMPPGYLFVGTRGMGKTTCARLIAMSLNCANRDGVEPCGVCPSCTEIIASNGEGEWYVEVDGATSGKVDDTRNLMASVGFYVPEGHYRVVMVDECHMLTTAAWNASLKTIEEPPPRVLFIFGTTEADKVIATVKSRCTPVHFYGVSESTIVECLTNILTAEGKEFEETAVQHIAKEARGSIRDGQTILEGFIRFKKITALDVISLYQNIDANTIITYFNNIVAKDIEAAFTTTHGWVRTGVRPELIIASLLEHLRNMIMDFTVSDKVLKTMLKTQKEKIGAGRVVSWIDFFYEQIKYIREYPMEYSLVLDLITIKLIDSMSVRVERKKKEDGEEKAATKKEAAAAATDTAGKTAEAAGTPAKKGLRKELVNQLVYICHGTIISVDPDYQCLTIKTGKGMIFDIVLEPTRAKSECYIFDYDLEVILSGYPECMPTYAHLK